MNISSTMEKIYPNVEELTRIVRSVACPEEGCAGVFKTESNLNLHLAKSHNRPHLLQNKGNRAYHCPAADCTYSKDGFFKQFKLLKQHYLKVHMEKNYLCFTCEKRFSTEAARDSHAKYCDVTFKCCDCDASYNCYETLKTHCRRKQHNILDKVTYKTGKMSRKDFSMGKERPILPKPLGIFTITTSSSTSEQGSQTDLKKVQKETQTATPKKPQFTVETQTIGDFFNKKADFEDSTRKSIKTQTNTVTSKSTSCNTSFNLNDFEFTMSSSTQTNCPQLDFLSNSTETSDLMDNFDSSFFNCHMETQTDFMFTEDLFNCDDYSNMYTQTCDNLLMSAIGLSNTETQTSFEDVLRSVESQTVMSHSIKSNCNRELTHMETQTELVFKQLLDEINA